MIQERGIYRALGRRGFLPLVIALAIITGAAALAQDRKISVDPVQMQLPSTARIQAAGLIGNVTLAVWGTTTVGPDGRSHGALAMQLFNGAVKAGEPRILTESEADVTGFVQVLSHEGRFLVIWNDIRSGSSSAYMRSVDVDGTVGSSQMLSSTPVVAPGAFPIEQDGVRRLLWSDSAARVELRAAKVGEDGRLDGAAARLDSGRIIGIMRPSGLQGLVVLQRDSLPPLLLGSGFRLIPHPGLKGNRFSLPYYLGDDGSMLTWSDTVVSEYGSIFDALPRRRVRVGLPSGVWPVGLPSRDSLGRIQVIFGAPRSTLFYGPAYLILVKIVELSSARFTPAEEIGRLLLDDWPAPTSLTPSVVGAVFRRGCGNEYDVVWKANVFYSYTRGGANDTGTYRHDVPTGIDARGLFAESIHATGCGLPPAPWVGRRINKHASEIEVLAGGSLRRVSIPAAMLSVDVADRSPMIMAGDGMFLVGYHRLGIDSMMMLAQWRTDGSPATLDSINVDQGASSPAGKVNAQSQERLLAGTGAFLFETRARWSEKIDSVTTIDSQRCTIYLPTPSGWKAVLRKGLANEGRPFRAHTVVYEPTSREMVLAASIITDNGWYREVLVAGFDADGSRKWMFDTIRLGVQPPPFSLIPISPSNYGAVTTYNMLRFRGDSLVRSMTIGHVEGARFLPLRAGGLLRWRAGRPATQILLETLDSNGRRVDTATAFLPEGAYEPTIIANPNNGGFILIAGSTTGVQAISIDAALRTIGPALRVSESITPVFGASGAIVGDRLNIIWEDRRDGVSDIYGRSVLISGLW